MKIKQGSLGLAGQGRLLQGGGASFQKDCGNGILCRRNCKYRDFPGVQWLRRWAPSAGGLGLIPDQGARSYVPQLSIFIQQLKTLWITPKTQCSQINKSYYFFFTLKEEFAPVLSKPKRLLPGWTVGNEIPGRTHTQETTVTLILTHSATHSAGEGHFHWVLDFLT